MRLASRRKSSIPQRKACFEMFLKLFAFPVNRSATRSVCLSVCLFVCRSMPGRRANERADAHIAYAKTNGHSDGQPTDRPTDGPASKQARKQPKKTDRPTDRPAGRQSLATTVTPELDSARERVLRMGPSRNEPFKETDGMMPFITAVRQQINGRTDNRDGHSRL